MKQIERLREILHRFVNEKMIMDTIVELETEALVLLDQLKKERQELMKLVRRHMKCDEEIKELMETINVLATCQVDYDDVMQWIKESEELFNSLKSVTVVEVELPKSAGECRFYSNDEPHKRVGLCAIDKKWCNPHPEGEIAHTCPLRKESSILITREP